VYLLDRTCYIIFPDIMFIPSIISKRNTIRYHFCRRIGFNILFNKILLVIKKGPYKFNLKSTVISTIGAFDFRRIVDSGHFCAAHHRPLH